MASLSNIPKDVDTTPPKISVTNRPINYAPSSEIPYIGRKAPSLQDVATGRATKCKATSTKMSAQKKSAKGSSSSAQPANPAAVAKLLATALQKILQASQAPTSSGPASSAPSPTNQDTADPLPSTSKPTALPITPNMNIPSDSSEPAASSLDPPLPQSLQISWRRKSHQELALGEASDDVKTKLRDILQLLNQDIGLLVQDAEGVRDIFRYLKGQLPADVEAALLPAAFIEGHQFKVL
ncbi:hypothetical protein C2845_PM06G22980 [Panicum miliaceum]|uniref:Uncharacterized protein n=1 Tax=Panicum miliaceum TaxID=4540 RepID=A0A3L6R6A9_PANMI|nr:hypothetical protein C2845_PM06G22980 [Panicum miliaceum]